MDCERIGKLLSAYWDGELAPQEQEEVERHLADCIDCAGLLADYQEVSFLLHDEFGAYAAPFDLESTVLHQIDINLSKQQNRRMSAVGWIGSALLAGGLAAILLSPVGIALLSIVRLLLQLSGNLVPLLWHLLGGQGLLTAGVVAAGLLISAVCLFAMRKMMQTLVPEQ